MNDRVSVTVKADETTDPASQWPQAEPVDGNVYGFIDPVWGTNMVAMSMGTWVKMVADVATIKARLDQLSVENIELKQGRGKADEKKIILLNPPGRIVQ